MLIRTFNHDLSRQRAIKNLPRRCSLDAGSHWEWECDCGRVNEEDEAQEDGVLRCDECGRKYIDRD